jgi:uncharacterized protein YggE
MKALTTDGIQAESDLNIAKPVKFIVLCVLFAVATSMLQQTARAQSDQRTLNVRTTGEVEVPADQVLFSIQISIKSNSPEKAFQQHRDREAYLARLIKDSGIKESQIQYQPVRISPENRPRPENQQEEPQYETRQQVQLRLNDFALFDTMQVKLIDNGFDNFSARFTSSQTREGHTKALNKALDKAQSKARQIAEQMNLKLGPVRQIDYSSGHDGPVYRAAESMQIASDSMMDFAQTLTISESVHITFLIANQ